MAPDAWWESMLRLVAAAACGGAIGLERELHAQPAGLRTHMVLAIGACLIMLVSLEVGDPGRIAAHVVSGMGFLGAGAILRFGINVKGLTTAACLWTAAGIGLAVGAGYYLEAGFATGLVFVTIFFLERLERGVIGGRHRKRFTILAADHPGILAEVEAVLKAAGMQAKQVGIQRDMVGSKARITLMAACPDEVDLEKLAGDLGALPGV